MSFQSSKYCRTCGAGIPTDAQFCESCGAPVIPESPPPDTYRPPPDYSTGPDYSDEPLPDVTIPPRLDKALSVSWNILWQDVVGGMVIALIFMVLLILISMFLSLISNPSLFIGTPNPLLSQLVQQLQIIFIGPLTIGFLGWAEGVRRGAAPQVGDFFNIAGTRAKDAIILFVLIQVVRLIIGAGGLYLSIIYSSWMIQQTQPPFSQSNPFAIFSQFFNNPVLIILLSISLLLSIIFNPAIESILNLAGWAVSTGRPWKKSLIWAYERVKTHYFGWWLAGLVNGILSGIGALACCVGMLVTMPWIMITWAELAGSTEEEILY